MGFTSQLRRCLFPEKTFRWYSRWAPNDLHAQLDSIKPLPAVQPSFRRIGNGYDELYLWVGITEAGFRMVARRLAPDTSPELRITGSISAHEQGSIMAGTINGGLTRLIMWVIFRLTVLLSVSMWLLKTISVQGGEYHLDASTFIAWLVVVAAVSVAPHIEFYFLSINLLPKVQGRFSAIDYPAKR